jgi:peptide/nickel transport system permease protein
MLQEGATGFLEIAPWLTVFPGLALTLTVFGFALLGDAVRDILDPRQSSQRATSDRMPDTYYKEQIPQKAD